MSRREFLPRLIRLRDVDTYLGMDRNRFNEEVRPFVTAVPIGVQGIAFDRLELDQWVDAYKERYGRLTSQNVVGYSPSRDVSKPVKASKMRSRSRTTIHSSFTDAVKKLKT